VRTPPPAPPPRGRGVENNIINVIKKSYITTAKLAKKYIVEIELFASWCIGGRILK
jgi:hypothetical protein